MKIGANGGGGRQPEFVLKVGVKGEQYHRRVGAAWRTKNGKGLNIKLDPGIALVGAHDISITLWRNDEQQRPQQQQTTNHILSDDDQIPY